MTSVFFLPHSNPPTVSSHALRDTEPGVKAEVMQIEFGPHSGCEAMILACVVTSDGAR